MTIKKCNKCGKGKSISEYTKHTNSKDGLRHSCKSCRNVAMRNYRERGSTTAQDMTGWTTSQLIILSDEINYILGKRREQR